MAGIPSTYGLGTAVRGPAGSRGGLAATSVNAGISAVAGMGQLAEEEQRRNQTNKLADQQNKQGALAAGISGAQIGGSVGGPWGAAAGFVIGAFGSQLF